jgi:polar amino acid transport system substrate-binding protein
VDWVEEVNFATMMAGLETDRYDAICTGVFLTGERARVMEYTSPYLFSSVVAVARADDTRFDADVKSINAKEVRISVQDGVGISLADRSFPEAQKVQLPDMASPSQQFVEVETGKADVAFTDASDFIHYSEKNPGKLRMIHADRPLSVYPWVIAVRKGEHSLASFINGALAEMIYSDEIRAITKRNGIPAGTYGYLVPNVAVK